MISVDVQFDSVDAQTVAEILIILIQCDPTTDEMLNAGLGGGPVLFAIRQWITEESAASSEQPGSTGRRDVWKGFRLGGDRHNLQPGRFTLQPECDGARFGRPLSVDGVDVGGAEVPTPMTGKQPGLFASIGAESRSGISESQPCNRKPST